MVDLVPVVAPAGTSVATKNNHRLCIVALRGDERTEALACLCVPALGPDSSPPALGPACCPREIFREDLLQVSYSYSYNYFYVIFTKSGRLPRLPRDAQLS